MAEEESAKKFEPEEYELVPITPMRQIEKRLEAIEKGGPGQKAIAELIETLRANQSIFQEVVHFNTEMIRRVSDLVSVVSTLSTQISEMTAKHSANMVEDTEETPEASKKLEERIEKLEKRMNTMIMAVLPRARKAMTQQYVAPAAQ